MPSNARLAQAGVAGGLMTTERTGFRLVNGDNIDTKAPGPCQPGLAESRARAAFAGLELDLGCRGTSRAPRMDGPPVRLAGGGAT